MGQLGENLTALVGPEQRSARREGPRVEDSREGESQDDPE